MPVNIHISGENAEQAVLELSVLAGRIGGFAAPVVQPEATPEAPKQRATRAKSEKAEPIVEPEVKPDPVQEEPESTDDDEPSTYSVEDLRAKAAEVAKLGKQAKVKKVLTDFGAASISAVPEDQRAKVYAALEAVANE
ncbi:hypothetical protein L1N85_11245 [Paenibacillus alkaliterrae]|uniref:hypothetical protein n=1 Tax=Paenibacillus alkaliterrae TaxID=320909 RepID=UPI001F272A26|nr:hypothetical protein [Paenibacillus alkaliterrae]MCF2939012.1 hypothetical protein [Paenibacillus alkaliterrae]